MNLQDDFALLCANLAITTEMIVEKCKKEPLKDYRHIICLTLISAGYSGPKVMEITGRAKSTYYNQVEQAKKLVRTDVNYARMYERLCGLIGAKSTVYQLGKKDFFAIVRLVRGNKKMPPGKLYQRYLKLNSPTAEPESKNASVSDNQPQQ